MTSVLILEDFANAMSERVLLWSEKMEAQRVQKEALNNTKEAKEFDSVRHSTQKHDNEAHKNRKEWKIANTVGQGTCQDSALYMGKRCRECGE